MSVGMEGSGPNPRTYSRAEYAALEAENARLIAMLEDWEADANLLEKERDAARAQLAAIQGGVGEAEAEKQLQEWARGKFSFAGRYKGSVCGNTDWALARAIHTDLLAHYQRITAAMAAELADAKLARDAYGQNAIDLQKQRDALRAELAEVKA